jgi:uncharacterized repeat protein (TIGR03803 family)
MGESVLTAPAAARGLLKRIVPLARLRALSLEFRGRHLHGLLVLGMREDHLGHRALGGRDGPSAGRFCVPPLLFSPKLCTINSIIAQGNGTLYGTTAAGGASGGGTVFTVSTSGAESVLHSFGSATDGSYPEAGLIYVNGALYGTTYYGGASGGGTVFAERTRPARKVCSIASEVERTAQILKRA